MRQIFISLILPLLVCCTGANKAAPIHSNVANLSANSSAKGGECVIEYEKLHNFFRASDAEFRDQESDAAYVTELRQCPQAELASAFKKYSATRESDFETRAKLSYLSIKLGYEEEVAKANLLKLYSTYPYEQNPELAIDQIMDMICDVLINHDKSKDFLAASFRLNPNGAMATMLFDTYAKIFQNSPEQFLIRLGAQADGIRKEVAVGLKDSTPKGMIVEQLSKVPKSSKAFPVAREMQGYVLKNNE